MPAAHTAERATRSQRGTDTRSRTGAAILPPPSASARDARPAPTSRARAPTPHWLAGRARLSRPTPPIAPDVALRDDVTSGQGGEGRGAWRGWGCYGAAWRPSGGTAGRLPTPPPGPGCLLSPRPGFSKKMSFSPFFLRSGPRGGGRGDPGFFWGGLRKPARLP